MSTFDEAVQDIKKAKSVLENPVTSEIKHPDPVKHKYISFAKSGIRIVAGGCLIAGNFLMAGICFIMAEVLGIVEEMV